MLKKLFNKMSGQPSNATHNGSASDAFKNQATKSPQPIYPSADSGYFATTPESLIQSNDDLMKRIRLLASCPDEQYEKLYLSPIYNLARFVHLLPASQSDHHVGAGGLFRLCLELAFFAGQSAHGKVFHPQESIQVRRVSEPQWRYATFLAGLCCETYRAMSAMIVTGEDGSVWQPYSESILAWLDRTKNQRYFVTFPNSSHVDHRAVIMSKTMSAYCSHRILNKSSLEHAFNDNSRVSSAFFATVGGVANASDNLLLFKIIDEIRSKVIEKDRLSQPARYGRPSSASHLESHLIDGIRTLISSSQWKINEEKAFVWDVSDGVFIVWRSASKSLLSHLNKMGVAGLPTHADTLAELLTKAQFFQRTPEGGCYFEGHIPNSNTTYPVVKLLNKLSILEHGQTTVLPVSILNPKPAGEKQDSPKPAPASKPNAAQSSQIHDDQSEAGIEYDSENAKKKEASTPTNQISSTSINPQSSQHQADIFGDKVKQPHQQEDTAKDLPLTSSIDVQVDPALRSILDKNRLLNLVRWLAKDFNTSVDTETLFQTEDGVCIAIERISTMGNNPADVAQALLDIGLLYTLPSKPNLKIHTATSPKGTKTKVFIISPTNAKRLGFEIG